jgi:hypothetical protein
VRQLRTELANGHFANSSTSFFTRSLVSQADTADVNIKATTDLGTQRVDGSTAMLQIMRLALSSLGAPQPPPHPDDLMHLEMTRKVRLLPAVEDDYLYIFPVSRSSTTFHWASLRSAVSSAKALELASSTLPSISRRM